MNRRTGFAALRHKQVALAVAAAFLPWGQALALPTGEQVVAGQVTVSRPTPQMMQVDQGTQKGIVNWQGFSIGASEHVNFTQPSASSITLNRVMGNDPSSIFGRLTANGQIFLTNPNGVLFARGAAVDVGSLFATSLSIQDQDFLAGRYLFSNSGGAGSVVNEGNINIITANGYAALAGPQVRNDGVIVARAGSVALAAGDRVSLDLIGDGLISISVDQAALNASVINTGSIEADGGTVLLAARSANALLDTVINAGGVIRANSLVERNGEIVLNGGSNGVVSVSGTIEAKGNDAGTTGGAIKILGDKVSVVGTSSIDASGNAGGGTVLLNASATYLGADTSIHADALETGDGGRVVLSSSDTTLAYGAISARGAADGTGGFVETSGGYLELAQAPEVGAGGTWLIDPYNIQIVAGVGTVNNTGTPAFTPNGDDSQIGATLINDQLNAGANVVVDTGAAGSPGAQAGDIRVQAPISKTVANSSSLTLNAFHDVEINQAIGMAGGALNVNAPNGAITVDGNITTANGAITLTANSLTNHATISNGGGINTAFTALFADSFDLAGGTVNNGAGVVAVRPRTASNSFGIEDASRATNLTNADLTSINTTDFVVLGSGMGANFTGNLTIGVDAQVDGGSKNLGFFRTLLSGGGSTTIGAFGLTTTGNVIVNGGGGSILSGGGTVRGNQVHLRAAQGVGTPGARILTDAGTLTIFNPGVTAGAFVTDSGDVTIADGNLIVGGSANNFANIIGAGGAYDVTANGALTVAGNITTANGPITLRANSLTNHATITNGGGANNSVTLLAANAFDLGGGTVNNGAGAVALRPRTASNSFGIEDASQATNLTNADLASINTTGFAVLGSGMGTNFTGNMSIGVDQQVDGGAKHLGFFRTTLNPGTISIGANGLTTSGNVIVNAGGGSIVGTGTAGGNQVQLRANTGIGASGARVGTAATTLAATSNSGGVYVAEANDVTLDTVVLLTPFVNTASNTAGAGGTYDLTANGALTVAGPVNAGNVTLNAASISETGSGAIVAGGLNTTSSGTTSLVGPNQVSSFNGSSGSDLSLANTGALNVTGLGVGGNATLTNVGNVTLSGPWTAGGTSTISVGSDIVLAAVLTSPTVTLTADGSITEVGAGAVVADTLTTVSGGSTELGGVNQLAFYNGSSGGDISLNNSGALTVTGLSAGGDATLTNAGNVTVGGAWTASGTSNITVHSDIVLSASLTSNEVVLNADGGSITETFGFGGGAVIAGSLTTTSSGSTSLGGENRVGNYTGNSGADLFFFNRGDLNVSSLNASSANLSADGSVTISGPWITAGQTGITAGGVGASLSETGGGFIQATAASGLTNGLSAQGSVGLNGPNRISGTLFGSSMQGDFRLTNAGDLNLGVFATTGGFATTGDVNIVNTGTLDVAYLNGRNVAVTNTGSMNVINASVFSTGAMNVTVEGPLTVTARGLFTPPTPDLPSTPQVASLRSFGGQNIIARSLDVSSEAGGQASIDNNNAGNQTITVSGGGVDVQVLSGGGFAQIANTSPGGHQTITVTNADHINVNGAGGAAAIFGFNGTQDISITGGGRNAITVGSSGALGPSNIGGGLVQSVTAGLPGESGSITIVGPASNGVLAGILTNPSIGGMQTIATSGLIDVTGGSAPNQAGNFPSGIGHNGSGAQTITAADIRLTGGPSGRNNAAQIGSFGGGVPANAGDQVIHVAGGSISVTGGADGINNQARINAFSNQTIDGNPDITMAGGAGGGAANLGNSALILAGAGRTQTIQAGTIDLISGTGSIDAFAIITGGTQVISTTGDLHLTGGSSAGTLGGVRIGGPGGAAAAPTNLTLNVGGDLVLTGSATAANGAGIGSSPAGTAFANNITIEAAGDVILNSGANSGVRIGSTAATGTAGGNISINGRSIQLNGSGLLAAIRTLDGVVLHADQPGGTISETGNGFVVAGSLTTTSSGSTSLAGPNQVSSFNASSGGDVSLNNTGALNVTGLNAGGNAALTNAGAVTISGNVSTSGTLNLDVAGSLAVVASGVQDAFVSSSGGQEINAQSLSVTAQDGRIASLQNFGGNQTITITGDGASGGVDVQVLPGGGFAEIGSGPGGDQSIAVVNGDHINVNGAGGNASIFTTGGMQTLSITGSGANAITVGSTGALGLSHLRGGLVQNVTAGLPGESGSITIVGPASNGVLAGIMNSTGTGGTQTIATSGLIDVTGGTAPAQFFTLASGIFHHGSGAQTITAGGITLIGGPSGSGNIATIGSFGGGVPANAGDEFIHVAGGSISITGGAGGSNNSALINALRDQTIDVAGGSISVTGGAGGSINRAVITALGNQTIDGNPNIEVTGGAGAGAGGSNGAVIVAGTPGRTQTIHAGTIDLVSGADNSATILGAKQIISAAGDVRLRGNAGAGTTGGVRIGGVTVPVQGPTDLTLTVAGDLLLTAGGAGNNVVLGSPVPPTGAPAQPHSISVAVGGDVILSATDTAGVRIGSSLLTPTPATGDISISAGRSIQLNGVNDTTGMVGIRTAGNVALSAGTTINESGTGKILANGLATTSGGNTTLTGPNQVSSFNASSGGDVSLNNTGALDVTGLNAGGNAALSNVGNVTLSGPMTATGVVLNADGGTITETSGGSIIANSLATTSGGNTSLTGPNQISSFNASSGAAVSLNNTGELDVTGLDAAGSATLTNAGGVTVSGDITTANGPITLTANSLTNHATISNGGGANTSATIVNADSFNLAGGTINNGAGVVALRPRTGSNSFGIESAGTTTLTNADIASVNTSDFVVLGSGVGTTFTGNMTIGDNAQVNGGTRNLGFFRSALAGGTTTIGANGLTTSGNVIVNAGGGAIVGTGTVGGNQVQLRANTGIGTSGARVGTAADTLAATSNSGGVFIAEANDVTLDTVVLNIPPFINTATNTAGAGGTYDLTANGALTIAGPVNAGNVTLNAASISESSSGFIAAGGLNTTSSGSTSLTGPNQVASFSGTSFGDLSLNNTSAMLTVPSIQTNGGALQVTQVGDMNLTGMVTSGAQNLDVSGTFAVLGETGAAEVRASGPVNIATGNDLRIAGGSGDGAHALLFADSSINLTVGGFLTINAGSGNDAWARVQTATRDSAISIHFPNLGSGGYFVNDVEGAIRRGQTGFLSGMGAAAPDQTLIVTYGSD